MYQQWFNTWSLPFHQPITVHATYYTYIWPAPIKPFEKINMGGYTMELLLAWQSSWPVTHCPVHWNSHAALTLMNVWLRNHNQNPSSKKFLVNRFHFMATILCGAPCDHFLRITAFAVKYGYITIKDSFAMHFILPAATWAINSPTCCLNFLLNKSWKNIESCTWAYCT